MTILILKLNQKLNNFFFFSILKFSSPEPSDDVEVFTKAGDDLKEYYDYLQCEETGF